LLRLLLLRAALPLLLWVSKSSTHAASTPHPPTHTLTHKAKGSRRIHARAWWAELGGAGPL